MPDIVPNNDEKANIIIESREKLREASLKFPVVVYPAYPNSSFWPQGGLLNSSVWGGGGLRKV